ncbi:hypothetical protein Rhe02_51940 [Rhizocola hellebori]|uniref:Uncharacterized protein n=1 Tax=Rhizocola hellebori TaxID=1392758 RepID=A0A8J3QBZ5_9ACTN|nr:hypothetical protein [Rhizocola hellebori]GIH07127.1 hypothetical protein Rhe02_51940 [Rhizocola hellebori]
MHDFDERLSHRLHELAGSAPDSAAGDATARTLIQRGRQARRRATALTATSLTILAGGLAVAAVVVATHPGASPVTANAAGDARTELVAAITASQSTTYQMNIRLKSVLVPGSKDTVSTGAFDPGAHTGYLRTPADEGPGFNEERLIQGRLYIGSAGVDRVLHFRRVAGRSETLRYDWSLGGTLTGSANPDELLAMLREEGATVTRNGNRGFHFEYTPKKLPENAVTDRVSGDITLDSANRIASVVYDRFVDWTKPGVTPTPVHMHVVMEFSGYGLPVTVQEPDKAD